MADLDTVLADLRAESASLDELVAPLPDADWRRATPAKGWTVAHQIAHLSSSDEAALTAVTDPAKFAVFLAEAARAQTTFADEAAEAGAADEPATILHTWREGRGRLDAALRALPAGAKVAWFGPAMSATSMATARLMETWAHGQDVADALGVDRPATARLRNIAHIGVRTRDFAFVLHGRTPPTEPFRVELTGPSGEVWAWGPDDAQQHVAGAALDFCLLVTQRRHRSELRVTAVGPDADTWLDIAQAYAGPPGTGRDES